jgi:histidinol-phosphate/aromatic aminotransferase/cobyric acid decarboxylase-like protein
MSLNYIKTVYSLFYPETKSMTEKIWKSSPIYLYEDSFKLPKYQTEIETDFKNQWLEWSKSQIQFKSEDFKFYNTAGSSEAIRESLADYKAKGGQKIYVFHGDYEGYQSLAESYNLEVVKIHRESWKNISANSITDPFYFSNPSSIDGNVWDDCQNFINFMTSQNPLSKLRIDLCYVGSSVKSVNLTLDSVDMIFFSLSKVFGVYFHRIGGVFSKHELKSLYGNQWFKNLFSLHLGISLLKKYSVDYFPNKYRMYQIESIEYINKSENLSLIPSDVIILATSSVVNLEFVRFPLNHCRYCITPIVCKKIYGDSV